MRYASAQDLRQAIDARLVNEARETGAPVDRLRRRMAFERLLSRLAAADPGRWVLKGGMALEMRWLERARTTKDLDLATRHEVSDPRAVHELLVAALSQDPDGDQFRFEVGQPAPISADMAGRPGWRVSVRAILAGRRFAEVKLDIVARSEELVATEPVGLPGTLSFAQIAVREIETADLAQHFAEKIHAMTRVYGGERPSSRVRDLVDLVLVLELAAPDQADVRRTTERVFAERATHPLPSQIEDPPASWAPAYEALAAQLDLNASSLDAGLELVRNYWRSTTTEAVGNQ
ncbi:MAG: nucleotidyl transferase AbiEii/AbiGii toxin family protein [Solirubrobacterales bacterium]